MAPEHQCGAKTRRGTPCRAPAMANGRCHKHGGPTPRGLASASLKHGLYSKHLPPLVQANYELARQTEEAKTLQEDVAVVCARIMDLQGMLQTGERGTVWDDLQASVDEFRDAMRNLDAGAEISEVREQLTAVAVYQERIAAKGKTTDQAWRAIGEWQDRKARLVTSEAKRAADQREGATAAELRFYVAGVVRSIIAHVDSPEVRGRISADLHAIGSQMREQPPGK